MSIPAHAEDIDVNQVLNGLQMNCIDIGQLDQIASQQLSSRGPAPPLSFLQILAVASQNHPNWNDNVWGPNRYSTAEDHGGDWILVATYERGYGSTGVAKLDGNPATLYNTFPKTEGGIVVGFEKHWLILNKEGGQFTYKNRSLNAPGNLMSDHVTIR